MMNQYETDVRKIMDYLSGRKLCLSSRKSHQLCYEELGAYLKKNGLAFSRDSSERWLKDIQVSHNRQQCYFWHEYVEQLHVFLEIGSIPDELFYQIKPMYDKVPAGLKEPLDSYLAHCREEYSKRSLELVKTYCSGIMMSLSSSGVNDLGDITYEVLDALVEKDLYCTKETRYVYLSHARLMFGFFADLGLCPVPYGMMFDDSIHPQVAAISSFSEENKLRIQSLSATKGMSAENFIASSSIFQNEIEGAKYQNTQIKSSGHILKALYLFLVRNGLDYTPEISCIWFDEIRPTLGKSWRHWRRILKLFELYSEHGRLFSGTRYTYRPESTETLPEWCRTAIHDFSNYLIRSFRTEQTARNYHFSCIRFCRFLTNEGIGRFSEVTLEHIRKYSITDEHDTPCGRSTSLSIVRQFLCYLEDRGIARPNLHMGIITKKAASTEITDVLSDEQVGRVYEYRKNAETPRQLRNAAIVVIGLELGLRASDVVNLRLDDIDWKNRKFTIVQKKTQASITLPISSTAGNSLFRYLKYGRPETESRYFFVHQRAPHGRLSTKVCNNALYEILPERRDVYHKGFHVTRRTFATHVLRNGAGAGAVMDALGHTDNTTVMKYLSFDEDHMRMCPLTLDGCGILLKGGLV